MPKLIQTINIGRAGQMSNFSVGRCPRSYAEASGKRTKPAGIDEVSINKKPAIAKALAGEVGWTGFEPATPCTPYKCATGLRHHPNYRDFCTKLRFSADFQHIYAAFGVANLHKKLTP